MFYVKRLLKTIMIRIYNLITQKQLFRILNYYTILIKLSA